MGDRTHNVEISCGALLDQNLSVFDMTEKQIEDMLHMVKYFDDGRRPRVGHVIPQDYRKRRPPYIIVGVIDNPNVEPTNPWNTTVIVRARA